MPVITRPRPLHLLYAAFAAAAGFVLGSNAALSADKVTFLSSWFAQAEHGGFYQAKATGLYEKAGLDVTLKMGGPQINGMQLLLGGETDVMMGYDLQVLKALEQGLPVITIATSFQYDLQGMMTHPDVKSLADLKDRTILVAVDEGEIQVFRRADAALHLQPAAVLRRQEPGAAGLSVLRAVRRQAG